MCPLWRPVVRAKPVSGRERGGWETREVRRHCVARARRAQHRASAALRRCMRAGCSRGRARDEWRTSEVNSYVLLRSCSISAVGGGAELYSSECEASGQGCAQVLLAMGAYQSVR